MTDVRLTRTADFTADFDETKQTIWVRSPISVIFEIPDGWNGYYYSTPSRKMLSVVTTDGQKVQCDDTPENRKALGLLESGDPPSILIRHEPIEAVRLDDLYDVHLEKTFDAIKKAKDEASR